MRKRNRHRIRKRCYTTELNLGVLGPMDVEIVYSGLYDRPTIDAVNLYLDEGAVCLDLLPLLDSDTQDELTRNVANHEADLTDYYYDQYRDTLADQ